MQSFLESNNETPPITPPITPSEPDNNSGELGHADSFTYAKYNSMDELNQIRVKFKQDIKDLGKDGIKKSRLGNNEENYAERLLS